MKCHIATHVGERTFGVLTKLDLMDKGTNALDVSFLICYITCDLLVSVNIYIIRFIKRISISESPCFPVVYYNLAAQLVVLVVDFFF